MKEAVDKALVVDQLMERVRALEQRVAALEGQAAESRRPAAGRDGADGGAVASRAFPSEEKAQAAGGPFPALERTRPPATWRGFPPPETPTGMVPVLGKAILGISGAYLLRAVAESGAVGKLPVIVVAIVYAAFWMWWAVRAHGRSSVAYVTYGITSTLILAPLLWESTVRFQVLTPAFTGLVLATFVVLALALSWRQDLEVIPWVTTLSMVITALALIVATHEVVLLTAALVTIALTIEIAAWSGRQLLLRSVPAVATNIAVLLLVDLMTSAGGLPPGYRPAARGTIAALSLMLLAIYGGSIAVRVFGKRERITIFEIVQGMAAFAIASWGAWRATQGSVAPALCGLFLLLAAACYWGTLSRFAEKPHTRNRRVSATWAAALLIAGSVLLFPPGVQVLFLSAAALAAVVVYKRTGKISLGWHASLYLAVAALASPLVTYVEGALAKTVPGAPDWQVWVVAVAAAICYPVGAHGPEDRSSRRLLWVIPAVLVGFAAAAFSIAAIVWLAAGQVELSPSRLSVIRTVVNCTLALGFGFLGSRLRRIELNWVAYATVGFGTLKLLFEDLRYGNAASLVVSLLFYGLILILLPRLMYRRLSEA